jgi:hypothetical protein
MTTAALVFALLPLLFHTGAGSELRAPMAAVVIGGNITSTLLSLILVPVAFNLLEGLSGSLGRVIRWATGSAAPEAPEILPESPAPAPSPAGGE